MEGSSRKRSGPGTSVNKNLTFVLCIISAAFLGVSAKAAVAEPHPEDCGWLVPSGNQLVAQPDPNLKPLDRKPLAPPPAQAKAAYCIRKTIITDVGDERFIELGLPLVIRSGDREGVLEDPPKVTFSYHRVGDRYFPGKG